MTAKATQGIKITEKQFQRQVQLLAKLMGWAQYHTWKSIHSAAGFPDLTLVRPPRVLFIELKTEIGFLTPAQREWQELLSQCPGIEYYLWKPADWQEIERMLSRNIMYRPPR